jgi:hypothetical protein
MRAERDGERAAARHTQQCADGLARVVARGAWNAELEAWVAARQQVGRQLQAERDDASTARAGAAGGARSGVCGAGTRWTSPHSARRHGVRLLRNERLTDDSLGTRRHSLMDLIMSAHLYCQTQVDTHRPGTVAHSIPEHAFIQYVPCHVALPQPQDEYAVERASV